MASSTSNQCFSRYHRTQPTADGFRNGHPMPQEYLFALMHPHHGYTVLQDETAFSAPTHSIGTRPGILMPSTDHAGNINEGFNVSENSYVLRPSDNHLIPTCQINHGMGVCSLAPYLGLRDDSHSTFSLHSHREPTKDKQTDIVSFFDTTGILNDSAQRPVSEPMLFGNAGWYHFRNLILLKRLKFSSAMW
jgi:hypothetical protein